MSGLPATVQQGAALDFARQEVERARDGTIPIFGLDLCWFDKRDNRRLALQILKWDALSHPTRMMRTVAYARAGCALSDEALRELIVEFLDRGEPLPTYLAAHTMDIAAGPSPRIRGQKRGDNFLRDIAITVIVKRVCDAFGLLPTGRSTRHLSACAIVAEALASTPAVANLSYKGVAEIWRQWGRV